ncbi:hypothetical protein BU24DRAFT_262340 [Aaosphaeria arxii CBS 175.79]|uniref:Uncharacterized protein n=1 Tax=Aaosphaeria arxii CBS 175.79 TaxID=1450172 RepID=A0A6A5XL09_9PLEO|nr:uncharacterized protein BU24DRAFT_262340 [Aaosphaeria arxii CBS 175.79]KAF2012984.1 hypothetical protein BU24DRAFT_262340 [Aaosphaeria arxii CBS 175.79]
MAKGALISAGAAATAIGATYKLGEFLYKAKRLKDVGPANAVYVRLIKRVRADLDEVKRLLTVEEVKEALAANPGKAKWVFGAMRDVRGALENIAPYTERVSSDVDDGRRVGIRHRVYWLLSEKEKLENREKELNFAHASLNEVIGYLGPLEPNSAAKQQAQPARQPQTQTHETHNTKIDVDIRRDAPERHVDERNVYIERHEHGPRRVEEREVWVEHGRDPRRVVEERETWVEHEHGPRHHDERHIHYDSRGRPQQYDEREYIEHHDSRYDDRPHDPRHGGRVDERHLHIERDPRDDRHVEARFEQRGPNYYEEKRYEQRGRMDPGLGRRPESFEDRVPERDTWMQSEPRRSPYGQYAEYGAPQPIGAAEYRRRFDGDPGFGDEIVLNPQPVPPMDHGYHREEWIEQRENYGYDEYGNKLPEQTVGTRYPQYPPRSRF